MRNTRFYHLKTENWLWCSMHLTKNLSQDGRIIVFVYLLFVRHFLPFFFLNFLLLFPCQHVCLQNDIFVNLKMLYVKWFEFNMTWAQLYRIKNNCIEQSTVYLKLQCSGVWISALCRTFNANKPNFCSIHVATAPCSFAIVKKYRT